MEDKPLKCWAAGLKRRRQCMCEARHGPALMNRMPGNEKGKFHLRKRRRKVALFIHTQGVNSFYWVMIIFKNSESWYFYPAFTSLSPDSTPQGASQSSGAVGLPGSGARQLYTILCHSLAPEFLVFGLTLGNVFLQKLSWHFLINRQNLFQGIVLLCTLVQSFCFHNVLFCPASHLILIKHPKWDRRKRIIIPILQERKLRLPLVLQCCQRTFTGCLSLTLAQPCLWHSF